MRLSRLALLLVFALPLTAKASETTAEHAANVYAQQELDAAPVHGNIPDYSLSADDLAKSQHLSVWLHVTFHFVTEIWGIISLTAFSLWLGAIAWMQRDRHGGQRQPLGTGLHAFFECFSTSSLASLLNLPI